MLFRLRLLGASLLLPFFVWASGPIATTTVFADGELIEVSGCNGTIQSTGYPGNYPNGVAAEIRLTSDDGSPIRVTTTSFELEGCCDFLRAYDGQDANATLIGEWNGTDLQADDIFESSNGVMFLRFTTDGSVTRPGFELEWQCLTPMAPVVDFSTPNEISCTGVVNFFDESDFSPTSWEWNFGDGNMSTEQNPVHNYGANGSYDVSLTACNDLGCNTFTQENYILVDPENTVCFETFFVDNESIQIGGCLGTIFSPNYPSNYPNGFSGEIQITSSDASPVRITVSSFELEGCCDFLRAYDGPDANAPLIGEWNGTDLLPDDQFQSTGNVIFLRFTSDGSVTRPGFELAWQCLTPMAPIVDFSTPDTISCNGTVNFVDESDFIPTSWEWDFGDGNGSTEQNPTHTYADNGTYTVTLTACNDLGCNTLTFDEYILVDPENIVCFQTFLINGATIQLDGCLGIIFSSNYPDNYPDNFVGGTRITSSQNSPIRLTVNSFLTAGSDFLRVYDGPDANAPLIGEYDNTDLLPGDQIQSNGDVLFLEFTSNTFFNLQGFELAWECLDAMAPVPAFSSLDTISCDGTVNFMDESGFVPTSWEWDFGDGNGSTERNPTHTYAANGEYTVTLTACNDLGCNTVVVQDYIIVDPESVFCFETPFEDGESLQLEGCGGIIVSTNYPMDYPNGVNSSIQLTSTGGEVAFTVSSFELEGCCDFLRVYDGPDADAPLIGEYNGTDLVPGDVVQSTGPIMFLRFTSDGSVTRPGFSLVWTCTANINNVILDALTSPICPATITFEALNGIDDYTYEWDFGDGFTATGAGPHEHTYPAAGDYDATLAVTDESGTANSATTITINSPNLALDIIGPDTVLLDQVVTYTKDGSDLLTSFTWSEPGGNTVMGPEYTTSWSALGTYVIRLDAFSDKICSAATLKTVEVVLTSSVTDANSVRGVSVYPNPAEQSLYFKIDADLPSSNIRYTIVDALGRQLRSTLVSAAANATVEIDINQLPRASYLLVLSDLQGNRLATRRFVKE